MADNNVDSPLMSGTDQRFIASRSYAHSVDANISENEKLLGWDKPTVGAQSPIPQAADQPSSVTPQTTAPAEAPSAPVAPDPSASPPSTGNENTDSEHPILDFVKQAGATSLEFAGNLAQGKMKPQTAAAFGDMASNTINMVKDDILNPLDDWAQRKGVPWGELIANNTKVDLGGYMAPRPITPAEHMERNLGQFIAQGIAFWAGGEAAGAAGLVSNVAKTGAGAAAAGAVSYAALDPHGHMIGDVLRNNPTWVPHVLQFAATPEGETDSQGRLRNAFEMMGMDATLAMAGAVMIATVKKSGILNAFTKSVEDIKPTGNEPSSPSPAPGEIAVGAPTEPLPTLGAGETLNADTQTAQAAGEKLSGGTPTEQVKPTTETPSLTAGQRFEAKSNLYFSEKAAGNVTPEEVAAFMEHSNLKAAGLDKSALTESLLKNTEAFDASKGGVVSDEQLLKESDDTFYNHPEKILNYVGDGTDEFRRSTLLAAKRRTRLSVFITAGARQKVLELADVGMSGTKEMGSAIHDWISSKSLLNRFLGATDALEADIGRSLRSSRMSVQQKAEAADAFLHEMKINQTNGLFTSEEEAITSVKQENEIWQNKKKDAEEFVKASDRFRNDIKYGSWSRALQNQYAEGLMLGLHAPVVKATTDATLSAAMPIETVLSATIDKVRGALSPLGLGARPYVNIQEDLEKYFGKKLAQISEAEKTGFNNLMNQPDTYTKATYQIKAGLQKATDEMVTIFEGMKKGKIFGNTDGSNIAGKQIMDKLTPEQFDALDVFQKAKYYLSNSWTLSKNTMQEVSGFFSSVSGEMSKVGNAYDWASANTNTPEEFNLEFNTQRETPNAPIRQMAMEEAQARTLQTPLKDGIWKNVLDGLKDPDPTSRTKIFNPLKQAIAPIANIGVNLTSESMQYMPGLNFLSSKSRDAIVAGGKPAAAAMGKIALGTIGIQYFASKALEGKMIGAGPSDPTMRKSIDAETGMGSSYIYKIGDKWYKMKDLGVAGRLMKVAADGVELGSFLNQVNEKDADKYLATAAAMAVDNVLPDFITGDISDVLNAQRNPESKEALRLLQNKATTLVPYSSVVRAATKLTDPYRRDVTADPNNPLPLVDELLNPLRAIIPGRSKDLPPMLNLWGQEQQHASWLGLGSVNISPIAGVTDKDHTVENELIRLGQAGPLFKVHAEPGEEHLVANLPSRTIQGVELTPWQYHDYVKLSAGDMSPMVRAGLMNKDEAEAQSKNGTRSQLNAMITNPDWNQKNDNEQRIEIANKFNINRTQGQRLLGQIYPGLKDDAIGIRQEKVNARTAPVQENKRARMPVL